MTAFSATYTRDVYPRRINDTERIAKKKKRKRERKRRIQQRDIILVAMRSTAAVSRFVSFCLTHAALTYVHATAQSDALGNWQGGTLSQMRYIIYIYIYILRS